MTAPKARPTTYKGIRMRSRLEADYAADLEMQGGRIMTAADAAGLPAGWAGDPWLLASASWPDPHPNHDLSHPAETTPEDQ